VGEGIGKDGMTMEEQDMIEKDGLYSGKGGRYDVIGGEGVWAEGRVEKE
jgi:hypothetical protein